MSIDQLNQELTEAIQNFNFVSILLNKANKENLELKKKIEQLEKKLEVEKFLDKLKS